MIQKDNTAMEDYFSVVKPLTAEKHMQRVILAKLAETLFQIENTNDGKKVAEQIDQIVCNILKTNEYPDQFRDVRDVALALGAVLGQAIYATYHWTWMEFGDEDHLYEGLVSPNSYYSFAPIEYIYGLLSSDEPEDVDVTVALLFNLLLNIEDTPSMERYTLIM